MGTNLPSDRGPAITWITEHLAQWADNAAAIGVDPVDVTAAASLTSTATNAKTAAGTARQASKDATLDWYEKADLAIDAARDLILEIKAFAASSDDPQVYVLAGLSPRSAPGEVPAPESPTAITAALTPGGSIQLGWTCRGPQGTFYIVKRRLDGEAAFSIIATVTEKNFTDNNLSLGVDRVFYQINAQKNEKVTEGDIRIVQLGSGNNEQSIAQIGGSSGAQSDAA